MRLLLLPGLLLLAFISPAQTLISGRLVDERQQPIPFASVALADGQTGTASNEAGEFSLRVPALPQQLTVLSIGYERATLAITKAGPLPAPVVLRASAVQLPEVTVRANAEAEELVRRCYAKLLRHEHDVQYGRGFYRQKTREFFDAFYNVKITPRNMPSWVLGEARYALTPGGLSFSNASVLVRLMALFQTEPATPATLLGPLRADALSHFTFTLRQTLREQERELAVIDFAPRSGTALALKGTLYLDWRTAAVFRVEREVPASALSFANPGFQVERVTMRLTTNYAPQNDSLTRLASVRGVTTINGLLKGFADETVITSSFFIYEYGPAAPGQRYPDTGMNVVDLAAIKKRGYRPEFWRANAVIKDSPIEEGVIQDFEGRKVFGKLN